METNIKVLGWLYIILGILGVLASVFVLVVFMSLGVVIPEREALPILSLVGFFVAGIVAIVSLPGIVVGAGLLAFKPWARVLALVLAILNLPGFPLGTILAIYTFLSLLNSDTERLFHRA